ncbi:MAG: matrixin family metalloprotease [Thermoleophilia bacterium]|nr:matrixin family metalloprotease [Thermoleophilia bacterium]
MPSRPRRAAIAVAAVVTAAAVVAVVVIGSRGGGGGASTGTAPPTAASTEPLPAGVPALPEWGPVAGVPEDFGVPAGGDAVVRDVADGTVVELTRPDGTMYATAEIDASGRYRGVEYYDASGDLELSVDRVDALPPGSPVGASQAGRGGCRNVQNRSGQRWTSMPIPWRLNARSVPRRPGASRVLTAAKAARATWARNRNRCGVRDASRVTFRYRGITTRGIGKNGINTIGFGETNELGGACVGAVACTFTWSTGRRSTESDIRVDKNHRRGYAAGGRPGRRIDLQSVLVHETGHTLGLEHVRDTGNVMYPFVRAGSTIYRRLGRGDALAVNALY